MFYLSSDQMVGPKGSTWIESGRGMDAQTKIRTVAGGTGVDAVQSNNKYPAQTGKVEAEETTLSGAPVEFSSENFQDFQKPKDFGLYCAKEFFCSKVDRNTGLQAGSISFLKDKVFHLQKNTPLSDKSNCTHTDRPIPVCKALYQALGFSAK